MAHVIEFGLARLCVDLAYQHYAQILARMPNSRQFEDEQRRVVVEGMTNFVNKARLFVETLVMALSFTLVLFLLLVSSPRSVMRLVGRVVHV